MRQIFIRDDLPGYDEIYDWVVSNTLYSEKLVTLGADGKPYAPAISIDNNLLVDSILGQKFLWIETLMSIVHPIV